MKPTKYEETISQLDDLIRDRKSFIHDDEDSIFNEDIKALKTAIKVLRKANSKRIDSQYYFMFGTLVGTLIIGTIVLILRSLGFLIII